MTVKNRSKNCLTCGDVFFERAGDSNNQWRSRSYCSMKCNNSSRSRVTDIFTRLESKQIKSEGCWGWSGSVDGKGYGTVSNRLGSGHSPEKAHRLSYENRFGPIPEGMYVCHKCDNPKCTNPDHLFLGSQKDNMTDCSKKGRLSPISIKNLRRSKALTSEQVAEIRAIKFVGKNGRGEGRTAISIAKEYGVCVDIVRDINHNRYEA